MNINIIKAKVASMLSGINATLLGLYELRLDKQELNLYDRVDTGVIGVDEKPVYKIQLKQLIFEGSMKSVFFFLAGMASMGQVGSLCSKKMNAMDQKAQEKQAGLKT